MTFDFVKCNLFHITPGPFAILLHELEHRFHVVGEAFDEPAVEVRKTKEGLDLLSTCCGGPLCNAGHLYGVHSNFAVGDDQAKILDRGLLELAFFVSKEELMFLKEFENKSSDAALFLHRFREDQDVI